MSSDGLANIYRNAAAVSRANCRHCRASRKCLPTSAGVFPMTVQDPRTHRDLFFEPRIDAQQLGIPTETAEEVAVWLHRFGVLRLWVRVHCPEAAELKTERSWRPTTHANSTDSPPEVASTVAGTTTLTRTTAKLLRYQHHAERRCPEI